MPESPAQPLTRPTADQRVSALIRQLGSDDAALRQSAVSELLSRGDAVRPAILKAIKSDDPGLRDEASQILLRLPWYVPDDPPSVRDVLSRFGTADIAIRRQVIDNLADLENQAGLPALCRLLREDPSLAVQWTIVARLREMDQGPQLSPFRAVQPSDNPPMLALCGFARLTVDPAGAQRLLQHCADLEFATASDDDGEFDFVVTTLSQLYCRQKQFTQAAQLRRRQFARGSPNDEAGVPVALLELFALHGQFGPLPGLADDLKLAGPAAASAKIQYALSRAYTNAGDAAAAKKARDAAFAASINRRERYYVGEFLYRHGWNDLAEVELNQFLKMPADPENMDPYVSDAIAHILLGEMAAQRGDDLAAAKNQEEALRTLGPSETLFSTDASGHRRPIQTRDIRAEADWHNICAAQAAHDQAQVSRRLDDLVSLKPTDPDIVVEVAPFLHQQGRLADATALFDGAFADVKTRLDADPTNPLLLNDAAWLCAKCDQRLPDALTWATKAVAAMPDDAAIIDTLAEVNFHQGHPAEAARLESQAISLDPQDTFMAGQLKRFQAAAATRPSAN